MEKDIKHFILKAGNESGKAFGSILYLLNYVFNSVTETEENIKKRDEAREVKEKEDAERRKKKEKEKKKKEEAQKKIEEEIKRKKEEEIQKRKREADIQRKKREEERIREEEERKKKWEEERTKGEEERKKEEEANKKSSTVSCIKKELHGQNVKIPKDIQIFINKPYDKKEYYKLVRKYHPDKKIFDGEVVTLYTKLINNHKPVLDIKNDESWQK